VELYNHTIGNFESLSAWLAVPDGTETGQFTLVCGEEKYFTISSSVRGRKIPWILKLSLSQHDEKGSFLKTHGY
jgi:hypothetical protein